MAGNSLKPAEKELLIELLDYLNNSLTLSQRKAVSRLIGRIVDNFDLDFPSEEFGKDRRQVENVMGRRPETYFMLDTVTGKFHTGTVKELAEKLETSTGSLYISFRRAAEKGSSYVYRRLKNGSQIRITPVSSDEELELHKQSAIRIQEDYEKKLAFKKRFPHVNEDGSY